MRRISRAQLAATLAVTAVLTLASCGNEPDSDPGSASSSTSMPGMNHGTKDQTMTAPVDHNDKDVEFATGMIPHHQQAVEMAAMALEKAKNAQVKQLATAIKAAQDPEIKQMSGWLTGWGEPVPSPGMNHSMAGSGMMTGQEMTDLGKAGGSAFDRMWVQLMIKHHQGAVATAKAEQAAGLSASAVALAKKIETDQTREIATLQNLLNELP